MLSDSARAHLTTGQAIIETRALQNGKNAKVRLPEIAPSASQDRLEEIIERKRHAANGGRGHGQR